LIYGAMSHPLTLHSCNPIRNISKIKYLLCTHIFSCLTLGHVCCLT
jgi:hypothetical protein